MTRHDHSIDVLNDLIETTMDSIHGYNEAAHKTNDPRFVGLFTRRENECHQSMSQLCIVLTQLGGQVPKGGTMLGADHQAFAKLHASLSHGDKAIIEEVERGEDRVKGRFEDALGDDKLAPQARGVIQDVYYSVRNGRHEMSTLKHEAENG